MDAGVVVVRRTRGMPRAGRVVARGDPAVVAPEVAVPAEVGEVAQPSVALWITRIEAR